MKKVLLTVFAVIMVFVVSAQISKGTILVSGSSNFSGIQFDKDAGDDVALNLAVKGGYFLIDNLALGLNLTVDKQIGFSEKAIGVGPFLRYYIAGKIFVGAGYTSVKFGEFSYSEIPVEVGYAAFLNDVVALEPSLSYNKFGGDLEGAAFGLNLGLTIYFGRD